MRGTELVAALHVQHGREDISWRDIVDICSYAQVAGVDVQDRRGEGKALDGGNRHAFEVPGWR